MASDRRVGNDLERRILGWHQSLGWGDHPESLAPFVPTPSHVVREMLQIVGARSSDILYDLGCGDGRILFMAVEDFKVERAVGYELNPEMVKGVQNKIIEKGIPNRISVYNNNFIDVDLSPATIVTLYLTTSGNAKLKPKFESELKEGTRVVSHDFPIHGWVTDQADGAPHVLGSHKLFLYQIPDCYNRETKVERTVEEKNRWERVKQLYTQIEKNP